MSEITIRDVKIEDLRRVSEIVVESWKTAYRGIVADEYLESLTVDQNYQKRLKDYTDGGFVVAEINNEVVGFCRYRFENAYGDKFPDVDCELCALYVKSAYKGNGVGKKIINYVMNDFETTDYIGRSAGVVTLEGEKKYLENSNNETFFYSDFGR